ncbi:MAG: hypothetical protein ABIA59_08030, partial [Candidatus Latescibacterota bacterium]
MTEIMVVQGRELHAEDIGLIRSLLAEHGEWRIGQGRFKDMAARTRLLKFERAGLIQLPKRRRECSASSHANEPIRCALRDLLPLAVSIVEHGSADLRLFNCLLRRYHYLCHRNTVGENIRYLVRDREGRPVGFALFGSAA